MPSIDFSNSTLDQRSVILTTEQPLLVIAGPGAGKTKTLVDRVIHLVADLNVPVSNILVATFTEKAAKAGVTVTNISASEPIVMLKHFAENPELVIE